MIDIGRSSTEPMLMLRANEHNQVLWEKYTQISSSSGRNNMLDLRYSVHSNILFTCMCVHGCWRERLTCCRNCTERKVGHWSLTWTTILPSSLETYHNGVGEQVQAEQNKQGDLECGREASNSGVGACTQSPACSTVHVNLTSLNPKTPLVQHHTKVRVQYHIKDRWLTIKRHHQEYNFRQRHHRYISWLICHPTESRVNLGILCVPWPCC